MNLADVCDEQGLTSRALEEYAAVIAADPNYGDAYYDRFVTLEKIGRKTGARADLVQACSLGRGPPVCGSLGVAQRRRAHATESD